MKKRSAILLLALAVFAPILTARDPMWMFLFGPAVWRSYEEYKVDNPSSMANPGNGPRSNASGIGFQQIGSSAHRRQRTKASRARATRSIMRNLRRKQDNKPISDEEYRRLRNDPLLPFAEYNCVDS